MADDKDSSISDAELLHMASDIAAAYVSHNNLSGRTIAGRHQDGSCHALVSWARIRQGSRQPQASSAGPPIHHA